MRAGFYSSLCGLCLTWFSLPANAATVQNGAGLTVQPKPVAAASLTANPTVTPAQQGRANAASPAVEADAPTAESGLPTDSVDVLDVAPQPAPQPRAWLRRSSKEEPAAPEKHDEGLPLTAVAVVLLGGLVGGALVLRMRRGAAAPWLPPAPVRVLSTTRIGPKATLVTADVYGKVLLLGVTEETVSELGWVDEGHDASGEPENSDVNEDTAVPRQRSGVGRERGTDMATGFTHVLNNVFGASERAAPDRPFRGNPNVAALIAARETRDVVNTNYSRGGVPVERRSPSGLRLAENEPPRIETQVAGLMRRRR